ncbi:MAG: ECF transporter S component [Clostridia bacterium]|nr:ECF transporter S component [Clostridia bacterium]MBQ8513614.1 ECF transporter S component [Clostridia bacterium]
MNNNSRAKTLTMVQIALLSALVVVLQVFFSAIRIGVVTLNFVLVPIVIAAVLIGPMAGFIVGAFAGLTTFIQVFTSGDVFYVFLMTNNAFATALICILKTALAGLLAGLVYRLISGIGKTSRSKNYAASLVSSVVCPVVNTGLFVLGMLLFFGNAFTADATFGPMVGGNLVSFVLVGLVGVNFFFELALNVIICPLICGALMNSGLFKKK